MTFLAQLKAMLSKPAAWHLNISLTSSLRESRIL
jgi:hypothetical protein